MAYREEAFELRSRCHERRRWHRHGADARELGLQGINGLVRASQAAAKLAR